MWTPKLVEDGSPVFQRIAAAIAADISRKKLAPGELLPTTRALAEALGVTVGTVARSYQEVSRTGLIEAGGRRGTRVATTPPKAPSIMQSGTGLVDLRGHRCVSPLFESEVRSAMRSCASESVLAQVLEYQEGSGLSKYREAGAAWFTHTSLEHPDPAQLTVCNGAQHALACCLLALTEPGNVIATESLTYSGLKAVASAHHLTLCGVDSDDQGLIPEALEEAALRDKVKVLVCVPDIHNPTSVTWSEERRDAIAKVVQKHGIFVIEDSVYSGLVAVKKKSLSSRLGDQAMRITGLSKTVAPGLRAGFIDAPMQQLARLSDAVRATSWMASPLSLEVATNMINSGAAARVLEDNSTRLNMLNALALPMLDGLVVRSDAHSPHLWIELPEPWSNEHAVQQLRIEGFLVASADNFSTRRDHGHHGVRISLGAAPDTISLVSALRAVRHVLLGGSPLRSMTA
jgi:DNA-binding transcriptional MocR family regulator